MSKRFSIVAMAFVLALAGISVASAQETKGPRMTIVEPIRNVGIVAKGERIDWSFQIKNTGNEDLQITKVQPTCGCTVADYDKVIKPGGIGKITAHVETKDLGAGPVSKVILIESNDSTAPSAQLTITGMIRTFVEAFPAGYVRFLQLQGDVNSQSIVLYSQEPEPFEVTGVEVPPDYVDFVKVGFAKIEKAEERVKAGPEGQNQYRIDVTAGGTEAKIGPLIGKIKVTTNSKHTPEYFLTLSGLIRPRYQIDPVVLNFGEVAPEDPSATRILSVRSNDRQALDAFQIVKVETSNPALFTAEAVAADQPGVFDVKVMIAKGAKPAAIDGTVTITTSDKLTPVTRIPVKGSVVARKAS
jgi:hypothetical protein